MKQWVKTLGALLGFHCLALQAADNEWWFDIEVIVFERGINAADLNEKLPQIALGPLSGPMQDPISDRLFPSTRWLIQAWPACEYPLDMQEQSRSNAWAALLPQWLSSACDLSSIWSQDTDVEAIMHPPRRDQIGVLVEGLEWQIPPKTHLLPSSALELTDISQRIRSTRGLTRLLHIAWRQSLVFGRDNALPVRVFGGRNYAPAPAPALTKEVESDEEPVDVASAPEAFAYDSLTERLRQPVPVPFSAMSEASKKHQPDDNSTLSEVHDLSDIWQFDGQMRIYLRYINKVPYLHVEQALQYRQPDADTQIQAFPLEETRRVISKQLHYFDHPLFGVVMQIRRFQYPTPLTEGH